MRRVLSGAAIFILWRRRRAVRVRCIRRSAMSTRTACRFSSFEAFPNIDYYLMVVPTATIQVKSGSKYELDTRTYTGAYKLQIDDVSHIEEMATTLHRLHPPGTRTALASPGSTDSTKPVVDRRLGLDMAVAFRTGSNSDGYVLNRVEAAVSETDVPQFALNAKVSIYADGTASTPGTELFTLKTPADVWAGSFDDFEESFWVPSGTTANLTASTWYWVVFAVNTGASSGLLPPRPRRQRRRRCQIGVEHPQRRQNQEPHHRQRPLDAVGE